MQILDFFWLVYSAGYTADAPWFLITWTWLLNWMLVLGAVLHWLQWRDRRKVRRWYK